MARYKKIIASVVFILIFCGQAFSDTTVKWQETFIPMSEASPSGLETVMVWPDDGEKHPMLIITNGSPRDAKERASMTANTFMPMANEFVKRGFAVAIVLRRGYGHSGGGYVEHYGNCSEAAYRHAALAGVADLHAAIKYLATLPQFDPNKIIVVGHSAGGFAVIALTANDPPQGLVAAISFAGGRGSVSNSHICGADAIVKNYENFGKTSRIPTLWIYAQNDHFFNPILAKRFYDAFTDGGGHAEFIAADPFNDEGHFLFSSSAGIPQWTPLVDKFLNDQHLVFVDKLLTLAHPSNLKATSNMSSGEHQAFDAFMTIAPHKAFAEGDHGGYGWRASRHSIDDAKQEAIAACQKHDAHCKIIAVDDDMIDQDEEPNSFLTQ